MVYYGNSILLLVWFVVVVLFSNSLVFTTGAGLTAGVEVWRWVGLKEILVLTD